MDAFADARAKMVESQLRTENVNDYDVLAVMGTLPRERFVPAALQGLAYIDRDIALGGGRFLMEPAPLARLLQLAELGRGERVLDIGCGTGYSAAALASLCGSVVALESDVTLSSQAKANLAALGIDNVKVVTGPLEMGHAADAPYDAILIDGAVESVPAILFGQLKDGGRLVAIVGNGRAAVATVYTKSEEQVGRRPAFNADARPLPGFRKPDAFVF
ncbi:MAG TPA: protein-L-isoaspartate O-methyltransferase [Bauldia sp.]|nr:protein-L-isoaspartate O-methyltransferase [Bauldia sp.]